MANSKITMQSKVLAKNIPHPFNCYRLTTQLNTRAFVHIEGGGPYEEFSWYADGSNFEPDVDAGPAEDIHSGNVELYENSDSITVKLLDACKGYMYPKEFFTLIKNPQFDLLALRERYPEELFNLIKKGSA
ncbi:MAG: hypothetical protein ACXV8O_07140 [Methylobacter sp.]